MGKEITLPKLNDKHNPMHFYPDISTLLCSVGPTEQEKVYSVAFLVELLCYINFFDLEIGISKIGIYV